MQKKGGVYLNTVEPIRSRTLILDFADYLKEKRERDYVLFMTGLHLGRRISDILPLKIRDIRDKDHIDIREEKTSKEAKVLINDELKAIFKKYCKSKKDYEYVFRRSNGKNEPITRQRVWQILNDAAKNFGYEDKIGCHTLRKTFGYWLYQDTKDAVAIQELLNQSDISVTKRYIGVNQDCKDKMVKDLSFTKRR